MDCIELRYDDLNIKCQDWAIKIQSTYTPDLIIFVARAGFPIAIAMNSVFKAEIGVVSAERKGNKIKRLLSPFFRIIPFKLRNILIKNELKSGIHSKNIERNVKIISDLTKFVDRNCNVLVIDDSIDTGYSIKQVKNEIEKILHYSVKIAGLNVWDKSKDVIEVDYCLYQNTIIKAPMSKDSKDYRKFVKKYNEYMKNLR